MRILFVSETVSVVQPHRSASTRYRCFHPAEVLSGEGHIVEVTTLPRLDRRILDRYDVVVFHRPRYSWRLMWSIDRLKRRGILVAADYDDLVFGEEHAEHSPLFLQGCSSLDALRRLYRDSLRVLRRFRHVVVSTDALAEAVRRLHPQADVLTVRNGLSDYWLEQNRDYVGVVPPQNKRITYLPGTHSHDRDFATVATALVEVLENHPEVTLRVVGPLNCDWGLFRAHRIERLGFRPYIELPEIIAESAVTIAPLRRNPFNDAKSALKFFESAAFGIPVVATPIPEIDRLECPGLFKPTHAGQWPAAISAALSYRETDPRGDRLSQHARETCHARPEALRLEGALKQWLVEGPG